MGDVDIRHQGTGHYWCIYDWADRNLLTVRKPLCERDAGDKDVLLYFVFSQSLDESHKPFAGLAARWRQANMTDVHILFDD